MQAPPPPRYISPPPPVQQQQSHSSKYNGPSAAASSEYWTLPSRRTQEGATANTIHATQQDRTGSGRYNTIASGGGNWNQGHHPPPTYNNIRTQPAGYGHSNPTTNTTTTTCGAYYKSSQQNPTVLLQNPSSMSNLNMIQQYQRYNREGVGYGQKYKTPTPASIPTVPRNNVYLNHNSNSRHGLHSSTPTKKEGIAPQHLMDMSTTLSPIHKYAHQQDALKSIRQIPRSQNAALPPNRQAQNEGKSHNDAVKRQEGTRLVSPAKSSMTAEELFAAIHKSKKKLNIKTDSDSYSRSASPSCSSMTSLSPGSSDSSINGGRCVAPYKNGPETGSLGVDNVSRNRHSWSPNSNECPVDNRYLDRHTPPPACHQAGSRQSWAGDRLGPIQQTSRNDFKRLLLQHGTKSSPSSSPGTSGGRLSAVEQLRLSRQQKLTPPPSSNPPINGSYLPRSPADKRTNGSKLLQSPRSVAAWRFASPRTDVLSSTILEDCAEEEKASSSPTQETSSMQPNVKLPSTTPSSHGHTLTNTAVRRPLNLSFGDSAKESSSKKDPLKKMDVATILQQYRRESSPKARSQLIQNQPINKTLAPEEKSIIQSPSTNKPTLHNNWTLSQELLSPSNIKENVNTNRQVYNNSFTASPGKVSSTGSSPNTLSNVQLSNYKARQLFLQQQQQQPPSALSNQQQVMQPSSPRIQVSLEKQRTNFYNSHGSPGRSILATIETKSPSKSTLETAL